uniref:Protein HGH1 C-terminal domain-containing protein n=1 Tax=Meloidogyne incognita TaxID=6306 RepID=A0A914M3N9_MELIC
MLSKDLQANKLLVALLSPLVDCEDKLSEEEIENLPVDLQYWEKKRNWDLKLWELTLCTVYQFCATRLGRSFLRNANIYPLLREMDNARILKQGEDNLKNGIILEENGKNLDILRALISILIRREDEMGIEENEDKLESIRELGI